MSKKLGFFDMTESPFVVCEPYDLDYETPKSSHQILQRTFSSIENHGIKIKSWSQLFGSKHSSKKINQCAETPPARKPDWSQPLAPIKSRRSINKSELKPKKLIFKDQNDYESSIVNLLSPMSLRTEKKIVVMSDDENSNGNERKLKMREAGGLRMRKQRLSDDKENHIDNLIIKNREMKKPLRFNSNSLMKNSGSSAGFRHLRI